MIQHPRSLTAGMSFQQNTPVWSKIQFSGYISRLSDSKRHDSGEQNSENQPESGWLASFLFMRGENNTSTDVWSFTSFIMLSVFPPRLNLSIYLSIKKQNEVRQQTAFLTLIRMEK